MGGWAAPVAIRPSRIRRAAERGRAHAAPCAGADPGVAEDEAEEDEVLDEERLPAARATLPVALRAADAGGRGAGPAAPRRI